jgi:integrase
MPVRLTETAIGKALREASATGRRDLSDAAMLGLRLRIAAAGRATWVLACRDANGRMRRFPVRQWPAVGISDAREKARALRVKVREGADPIADARRRRAITRDAAAGIGTLRHLLDLYGGPLPPKAPRPRSGHSELFAELETLTLASGRVKPIGPGVRLKSWPVGRARIERVFAKALSLPLERLGLADLQMLADQYPAKQIAASAVRCLRPVLKWGAARGYAPEVATAVKPPATVTRRDRVLRRDELAALLPQLRDSTNPYRRALYFMLLTLARREEVAGARWRDVDRATAQWHLPKTKNGLEHVLPLSRQALRLLCSVEPGKPDDLIFAARGGGHLVNWYRETKVVMADTGTTGWTRHDLRRTGATLLGQLGVEPHVIEAALNHTAIHSRLAATYNRSRYLPAVRVALQLLADQLDRTVTGNGEVLSLPERHA